MIVTHEIIALLENPDFKKRVLDQSGELDHFRDGFCGDCPVKKQAFDKATDILKAMNEQFREDMPESDSVDRMLKKILSAR